MVSVVAMAMTSAVVGVVVSFRSLEGDCRAIVFWVLRLTDVTHLSYEALVVIGCVFHLLGYQISLGIHFDIGL